jgi:hypothetical protein
MPNLYCNKLIHISILVLITVNLEYCQEDFPFRPARRFNHLEKHSAIGWVK